VLGGSDKLVNLAIATACVAVALELIVSASYVVEPTDVAAFRGAISSVALRPGSKRS